MTMIEVLSNILKLISGIGVFLLACEIMSKNLEAISSNSLKKMFARVSGNKFIGVMIGALATVAIQSSGATTVMTIGFVSAGIISLSQGATIIYGGEIGTTITAQIVALGLFSSSFIDLDLLFSALCGIGIFINMFAKKEKGKLIGYILAGIGLLFVGLSMMSSAMESFAQLESLKVFLASIKNPVLLIILGAVITAIIQSSSAITSVTITMLVSGLIVLEQGIYITLGANIGTCLTGMLAGLKSSADAKRTALIQLIFNVGGVVLLLIADTIVKMITFNSFSVSILIENMFAGVKASQLAMFHTLFNIASVAIVLPFSDKLVEFATRMIADDHKEEDELRFFYIDRNMLSTPAIAVGQVKMEIMNMAKIAIANFEIAISSILDRNLDQADDFSKNERELNFLNKELVNVIVEINGTDSISHKDFIYLTSTYKAISDFERIGDYSENIMEYAKYLCDNNETVSEPTRNYINALSELISQLYTVTMNIYSGNKKSKFSEAKKIEQQIDDGSVSMSNRLIEEINNGACSGDAGAQLLKLSSDLERIGDHLININDKNYEISH